MQTFALNCSHQYFAILQCKDELCYVFLYTSKLYLYILL